MPPPTPAPSPPTPPPQEIVLFDAVVGAGYVPAARYQPRVSLTDDVALYDPRCTAAARKPNVEAAGEERELLFAF